MSKIPQEVIDRVLDRLDIVEVISGYLPLKKTGRSFKACCPFHNEKTPSFVVSPEKQIYHCFGCSAGGNVIGFIMQQESLTFPEAVRVAAEKAGIEIPKNEFHSKENGAEIAELYEVNKVAAAFYQSVLKSPKGKAAQEYLKQRGIENDTLTTFRIGYAPDEWDSLRKFCEGKGIKSDVLRLAGLTIPSEKGKGDYDRFRNRITFPIFNERGGIVGFGGRVMDGSLPKYINSPETPIYSKSGILYGLNFTKKGMREKGAAVLVEGYLDVVIPFQRGVSNVAAASGTALTGRQISILRKYTDTVVIIFDADKAGEAASLRGLDMLVESGLKVRVATLPENEDPDSYVRKYGGEKFNAVVQEAKDVFEYKLDLTIKKMGAGDIGGIADEMLPTIAKINNAVVQADYLRKLAGKLGVHESALRHELGKVKPDYTYHFDGGAAETAKQARKFRSSEIHLLGLAISSRKYFKRIDTEFGFDKFRDEHVVRVVKVLRTLFDGTAEEISPSKLLSRLEADDPAKEAVVKALEKSDITKEPERAVNDCIACMVREDREERLKGLMDRLREAQRVKNDPEMEKVLFEINRIHKEKVM